MLISADMKFPDAALPLNCEYLRLAFAYTCPTCALLLAGTTFARSA
jgi:hypothetical protein